MRRRTFIQMMAGGIAGLGMAGDRPRRRRRLGAGIKKLVVVFQRGGNDGLNTLIPVGGGEYSLYANLRPSIRVAQGSLTSLPGESFFALHPAMASLVPIFQAGHLNFIHAVGYPDPDRSHFESQAYLETAVPGNALLQGWLNRYLQETAAAAPVRGIAIGNNIPQMVAGPIPVPVSTNFGQINIGVDPALQGADVDAFRSLIRDVYDLSPTTGAEDIYTNGQKIFQMVDSFADRDLATYQPENGASYPDTSLGWKMRHAAQMLKDDNTVLGIEVVTMNHDGYDTHANQVDPDTPLTTASQHPWLLNDLAQSMASFYTDMGATRMNDVLLLVVSEFGRRAYQNESFGTDHGTGSLAMVMGGSIQGGTTNASGTWPGLANLYEDDDLMWVTDYRDIYWEILSQHFGVDSVALHQIIPGHTYSPVGFLV